LPLSGTHRPPTPRRDNAGKSSKVHSNRRHFQACTRSAARKASGTRQSPWGEATRNAHRSFSFSAPEQKRSKTEESLKESNGDAKPNGLGRKPSGKLAKKPSKSASDFVQTKPYFNPLQSHPNRGAPVCSFLLGVPVTLDSSEWERAN